MTGLDINTFNYLTDIRTRLRNEIFSVNTFGQIFKKYIINNIPIISYEFFPQEYRVHAVVDRNICNDIVGFTHESSYYESLVLDALNSTFNEISRSIDSYPEFGMFALSWINEYMEACNSGKIAPYSVFYITTTLSSDLYINF